MEVPRAPVENAADVARRLDQRPERLTVHYLDLVVAVMARQVIHIGA